MKIIINAPLNNFNGALIYEHCIYLYNKIKPALKCREFSK